MRRLHRLLDDHQQLSDQHQNLHLVAHLSTEGCDYARGVIFAPVEALVNHRHQSQMAVIFISTITLEITREAAMAEASEVKNQRL